MKSIWYYVGVILVLAICVWLTYLIGTSDLPDWVKFLLLR